MKLFNCLILIILSVTVGYSQSRSVKFDSFDSGDGLSENNVHAIYKDSYGFMWFGTDDGLNRFDGYSFAVYRPSNIGDRFLPGNRVRCISETNDQDIVVGFENAGLCLIDRKTDSVTQFRLPLEIGNDVDTYTVYDIEQVSDSVFWIATDYGVYEFTPHKSLKHKHKKGFAKDGGLASNHVRDVLSASTGFIWIGYENGVVDKYDPVGKRALRFQLGKNPVTTIGEDDYGNIWVGTWGGGLCRIAPSGDTLRYMPDSTMVGNISDSLIAPHSIASDALGRLWVGTANNGLNELSHRKGADSTYFFIKHRAKQVDDMSLSKDAILSVFYGSDSKLWIGHNGGGVSKLDLHPKRFYNHVLAKNDYAGENVQAINVLPNGNVWVGTQNDGIYIFNKKSNDFVQLSSNINQEYTIPSDNVRAISDDTLGFVWVGTSNGVVKVDVEHKQIQRIALPTVDGMVDGLSVNAIYIDTYQNVWIALSKGGVFIYKQETDEFESVNLVNYSGKKVQVLNIKEDQRGYVWFCTKQSGAYYFKPEFFVENIQFVHLRQKEKGLNHQTVNDVAQTSDGVLWLATAGGGVNVFDENRKLKKYITENDGLPSNVVRSITIGEEGNIWLSTHKGLAVFSIDDHRINSFNEEDGLMSENFIDGAVHQSATGEIYFGADNGLVSFRPSQIISTYDVPKVVLSRLKIFNQDISTLSDAEAHKHLRGPLYLKDKLRLSYEDYVFSIEFAAIELQTPDKCEYKYMLEGFDDKWISTDASNRTATYTNLRNGKYVFKVKASNGDGVWSKEPTNIKIEIMPPFWETLWFRMIILLVLAGIVLLWFAIQRKKYDKRREILEALVEVRTKEVRLQKEALEAKTQELQLSNSTKDKFFSIIAHDLKSPFNAFIGFTSMLKTNYDDYPDEKKKYIIDIISNSAQSMFELLNNLLSWARAQSGVVEYAPERLDLREQVENILLLLTTSAGEKRISLVNTVANHTSVFADKNLLAAVLRNLVSNSIKFTEDLGSITVSAKVDSGECIVTVVDTGVGMTDEQLANLFRIDAYNSTPGTNKEKGTGLGLVVVKEFVEINKGKVFVQSKQNEGTTITFSVPV